jgi:glycine cleavage system aminomethyltransferase T
MEKKMTKKEMFTLIATLNASNQAIVDFCNHEIELLDKKKSNGNAKANEKMDKSVELVYNALVSAGVPMSASELIAKGGLDELANEFGVVSTQKVSAYLNKLVASGRVTKTVEKKKTLFSIVTE